MKINNLVDNMKDSIVKSTQELIAIKSVKEESKENKPFGEDPAKALEYCLNLCSKMGFKTVNLDNYIGYAEYGEGEEYIGVLGHVDVVPEGDGWIYPPYGGEVHEGKIFGRGTMDDKGPMIACVYGLKAIKDAGIKPAKKIRVIFGTNEESGSEGEIDRYFESEKAPIAGFTPDAEYPIINGEKGLTIFDLVKELDEENNSIAYIKGGQKANMVPDYCEAGILINDANIVINAAKDFGDKTGFDISVEPKDDMVVIKSKGVSAHGSLPQLGKNAIMQLFMFIGELPLEDSDIVNFIKFMNKHIGMEVYGESFGVGLEDEVSGKLSFNVGVVNMDKDKITMTLNLRYPVTCKFEDMMNGLNKTLSNTGINMENMDHQEPLYFPEDNKIIKILSKVYEEQTGDKTKLLSIGGGTYAKEMPNIVAFGPIFPGEPDLDHQANEYIKVDDLIKNAKIYAHAMYELAK
ncbi:dipeptidase PepV [Clostridium massiliodielmoense]|uniref:dipeptidase PepV n=1 Tax=Clostridium massiliodielmoense TaxID=1776385 RepID=UPI000A271141|nr:dipeptidase PepV [Clostridium massiliodielmoense]